MKIVIDDKIPYIKEVISQITDNAVYKKGADICNDDVKDADAMIVRTRTKCNRELLEGSSVKFIATATIGFDHIDTEYLKSAGITWMNCPGCNSGSVAQYLRSVLLLLKKEKGEKLNEMTLGIVGCGHVGQKVKAAAEQLGMKVLVNDPPRQDAGEEGDFVSINDIKKYCDVITFHTPMVKEGKYKTTHIADKDFFNTLSKTPYIINTSRGGVVDNAELLNALKEGKIKDAVIDTWENEPAINLELLEKIYIGTPHIAGYSADGKVNADNMVIEGLCQYFNIKKSFKIEPPKLPKEIKFSEDFEERCLQLYNPLVDSKKLKSEPDKFEELRGNYPVRRE